MTNSDAQNIPVGWTLRHTLLGHTVKINRVAWTPDGRLLVTAADDGTLRVWDVESGEATLVLNHVSDRGPDHVEDVAITPDGRTIISGTSESLKFWDIDTGEDLRTIPGFGPTVELAPNGQQLITCISPIQTITILGLESEGRLDLGRYRSYGPFVAVTPDGRYAITTAEDEALKVWDIASGELVRTLREHGSMEKSNRSWGSQMRSLTVTPDGERLIAGSEDHLIYVYDLKTGHLERILEGHTESLTGVSVSPDGGLLLSKGWQEAVRLWRCDDWSLLSILEESEDSMYVGVTPTFHPKRNDVIATFGDEQLSVRVWDLDLEEILGLQPSTPSVHYTTAKIVLVGDSGVGKTGLGWRLAHGTFEEHSSTHGQQFWVVYQLVGERPDNTECEAVLWDLAGQPDYRLVHSLFLDDVALALVLFDPTNRQEPLSGVSFWLKQLKPRQDHLGPTILIGARSDRGTSTLTEMELEAYCQQHDVSGGFIGTSAKTGEGLPELIARIKAQIPWGQMTATITTTTFKRVKEYVLSLKEDGEQQEVLVSPTALRQRLENTDPGWGFSDDEMMTAVQHLETHGYVNILRGSRGDVAILLAPDLLANLASSFVLEARRNPLGLGFLEENRLLRGEHNFPELIGLAEEERKILLDAAAVLFLERNICFRETFNESTFLVFPALINEKRPVIEDAEAFEDASYRISGAVENVYASLVVLLGYTNTFVRTNQWQNQAQYQLDEGQICGFRQAANREGEIEMVLYYALDTPEYVQLIFQGLFERFLSSRDLSIVRYEPVICSNLDCEERQERSAVMRQLNRERDFIFCSNCGNRLTLPVPEQLGALPRPEEEKLVEEEAVAGRRTAFEAALVHVKRISRDQDNGHRLPTCFISYAWGVPDHERWVVRLANNMKNASIDILLDRWHNPPGYLLDRFTDRIASSDFVVVVGTPELRQKYKEPRDETQDDDPIVASELTLINMRLRQPTRYGLKVIPLLLDGEPHAAFTPQLQNAVYIDFRDEDSYFVNLLDLIWRLYGLSFDNPLLDELRESMSPQR